MMEKDAAEWDQAVGRGKAGADRAEVAWAVPLRGALEALAYVRNAGIVNRMSLECLACRSSVRSAVLR